jgi:hypothetical protein
MAARANLNAETARVESIRTQLGVQLVLNAPLEDTLTFLG